MFIRLSPRVVEDISHFLYESFESVDLDSLKPEHIATMLNMYIAGDTAADEEWFDKNQAP